MKKLSNYTAEQIFSLCLLIATVITMLFCAIVRLCGGLWFAADLTGIKLPSEFWQERIINLLYAFELTFVYKILCRSKWKWCISIAIGQTILVWLLPSNQPVLTNIVSIILMFVIPFLFMRKWKVLFEVVILYAACTLYGLLFLVGRIGGVSVDAHSDFVFNLLGTIDYKLFVVSLYLFIKQFGGIKIWKSKIFDQKTNKA